MGSVLYTGMGHESILLCSALCSFKAALEGRLPHTSSPLAATMSYERCRRVANLGANRPSWDSSPRPLGSHPDG